SMRRKAGQQSRGKSAVWIATSSCAAPPEISKKAAKSHNIHKFAIRSPQLTGENLHIRAAFCAVSALKPLLRSLCLSLGVAPGCRAFVPKETAFRSLDFFHA